MKTTVNLSSFRQAFIDMGRKENFSYEGLEVLFDYLEEMEQSTGEEMELDVIALCCDFSEESWQTIAESYDIDLSECEDDEERKEAVRDYLDYHTMVAGETDGGFVYVNF